jgi:hypothetical protein
MELEIDRVQKLPELKVGDIKNNVQSCKLRVISSRDRFAYAIEIEYIDERKEEYVMKTMGGEMIAYDVLHKDGMTTTAWTFPIRTSLSEKETDITIGITPYNEISTGKIRSATLELQKQDIKEKFMSKMVTISSFPLVYFK